MQREGAWAGAAKPRLSDGFSNGAFCDIGVGAFGTVCKARDSELDRIVAIKIPRAGNLSGQEDVDRLLREARSAAQLRHPGIVSVYDAGQADGTCFIVSEYIQGATLSDRLSAGRLTFRQTADLVAKIADAAHHAHVHGVIHRDIKPSHIMLEISGVSGQGSGSGASSSLKPEPRTLTPRLMDFGLAKREALRANQKAAESLEKTKEVRQLLYVAHMNLAQAAWEDARVGRVRQLLEEHGPETPSAGLRGFEWFYWHRLCHRDLRTLKGHTWGVRSVAFSPYGTHIASASYDQTVKLWDAATGQETITLKGHTAAVTTVAFSQDGARIASASEDGTVMLWDAQPLDGGTAGGAERSEPDPVLLHSTDVE